MTTGELIERFEAVFPRVGLRPRLWSDAEVRDLAISLRGSMTIDAACAAIAAAVGSDRCPSRTALGRFWQKLDAMDAA